MSEKDDREDFSSKRHLLYIVLGNGAIMAVTVLACVLRKIRICFQMERASNSNTFTDPNKDCGVEHLHAESLSGNYWTIVSNERGELSTSTETNFERVREPLLTSPTIVPTENETGEILKPDNIKMNEESDEYLNPVPSYAIELDEYVHPVNSDFVELDEYIHPVNSDPMHTINKSIHFSQIL